MRRFGTTLAVFVGVAGGVLIAHPSLADACAGLIGSNGAVNPGRPGL